MINKVCLYVGQNFSNDFGGGIGANKYKSFLSQIFGDNLHCIEIDGDNNKKKDILYSFFSGYVRKLNKEYINQIKEAVHKLSPNYIFINTSCYGIVAKIIKKIDSNIKVYVFFHNIEISFTKDEFIKTHNIKSLLLLPHIKYNERSAVKYADKVICLNERDSKLLHKYYGKCADCFLPVSFKDSLNMHNYNESIANKRKLCIFIGSCFYANYLGILWFIKNVAPFVNADIWIVGKNFEYKKDELEILNNVKVIGSVTNTSDYYYKADIIIAPIFDGAGMKVKTAEALMYGKTIMGTPEAFEGYDLDFTKVGALCRNDKEFIDNINSFNISSNRFNKYSRMKYEMMYSDEVSFSEFKKLFE